MNDDNPRTLLTGLKLFAICAVAAFSLGALNEVTEPEILARKIREEQAVLEALVPDATLGKRMSVGDDHSVRAYYEVQKNGGLQGFILDLDGLGYGGSMKLLAAYDSKGTILDVRLLDNDETPGLGKKAEASGYMDKFRGTGGSGRPVPVTKEMLLGEKSQGEGSGKLTFGGWFLGEVEGDTTDSVSGATITFVGISKALDQGSRFVQEELGR